MKRLVLPFLIAAVMQGGCRQDSTSQSTAPRPHIITYSPALTAIVFEIGLGDHVVGVTTHCELPSGQKRPVAGDRQNVSVEMIVSLEPDVILIQQDPKDFEPVRQINPDIRIEHFTIETLGDVGRTIERIARILHREQLGKEKKREFTDALGKVYRRVSGREKPRVLMLTQVNPPVVPGRDSFLHEMIDLAGGEDVTAQYKRWTQISDERILQSQPEVVIAQSSPSHAERALKYLSGLDIPAARTGRVFVVTDPGWTIPSTRLGGLAGEMAEMIHPESTGGGTR